MDNLALVKYKEKLIETLKAFDEICSKYNINYYACSGTAIGAVRHQGFIPWDDDIDVFMLKQDYEKLISICKTQDIDHYKIAQLGDKDYIYSFAKFYDSNTTLVEWGSFPKCVIGAYIDVFPFYEVSGSIEEIRERKDKYMNLYERFQYTFRDISLYSLYHCIISFDNNRYKSMAKEIFLRYGSSSMKKKIRQQLLLEEDIWKKSNGEYLLCPAAMYPLERELMPKTWVKSYKYVPFESYKIRLMDEFDKYLTQLHGNYMELPPEEKRIPHHSHYYLNLKEGLSYKDVKQRIAKGETLVY